MTLVLGLPRSGCRLCTAQKVGKPPISACNNIKISQRSPLYQQNAYGTLEKSRYNDLIWVSATQTTQTFS
jgi:hypothetical protein